MTRRSSSDLCFKVTRKEEPWDKGEAITLPKLYKPFPPPWLGTLGGGEGRLVQSPLNDEGTARKKLCEP